MSVPLRTLAPAEIASRVTMHFRVDASREERERFVARAVQLEGLWSELLLTNRGCEVRLTLEDRLDRLIAIEGWVDQSACVFVAEFRHRVPIHSTRSAEFLAGPEEIPANEGADLVAMGGGSDGALVEVKFAEALDPDASAEFVAEAQKFGGAYASLVHPCRTQFHLDGAQWFGFHAVFGISDDNELERNLAVIIEFLRKSSYVRQLVITRY